MNVKIFILILNKILLYELQNNEESDYNFNLDLLSPSYTNCVFHIPGQVG